MSHESILDLRTGPEPVRPETVIPLPVPAIVPPQASESVVEKRQVSVKPQAVRDGPAARYAPLYADRRAVLIEQAVQDWRMTPRGSGHVAFFTLNAALSRDCFNAGGNRERFWEEAAYGYSPRKHRGEVKDIMKGLGRSGTLAGAGRSDRD